MKPAKRPRKIQTDRSTHMRDEAFADLKQAFEDALAFERGERRDLNVTRFEVSRSPKASVKLQRSDKR